MDRSNIEEDRAWARRVLRKTAPTLAERKLTQTERIAAWSAQNRADEASGRQTRSAVEQTRRDLHTPGSAFAVGGERYAADGSRWKRVA